MTPTEARALVVRLENWDDDDTDPGLDRDLVLALRSLADQVEALENPPSESAIRASERERCAKLLESLTPAGTDSVLLAAAKEIRVLCSYPLCDCNYPTDNCGRTK